jgi:Tol biopolymer transport system component/predicted Ser/Thr protein kinase
MIGQRLLHYEITEKLGEGGMGVVYKARDTHLDRFVAIKVLPPEKVADAGRKARFVQEAKAASALNHPNIVTVHDISSDGGVDFIAMEYVSGKTLDCLIPRKGLRLGDALKIAVQIADALTRAHAAGIVHRDLKPSNLMVDEHGHMKVLDFGLAKLTETALGEDEATRTAKPHTEEGTVVGTAAYMSPEQAEGKTVDARSDIFSFGSVLYEMVTGQRAFRGDSRMSTLSAVIGQEPKPLEGVPYDLEKIVTRCLRKQTARRFQHMDDVKIALEEFKEESASGWLAGPPISSVGKRARWRLSAAAAVPLVAVAAWWLWHSLRTPVPAPRVVSLTTYPGRERHPAFSPDGRQVAFSWNGEKQDNEDIYVRLVGSGAPLRLTTDPAPDRSPVWSPDGNQIAFVRDRGDQAEVYLTPALGGQERKLADLLPVPRMAGVLTSAISWSPDGRWLAVAELEPGGTNGIFLIPVERGEKRKLISSAVSDGRFYWPAFSPRGDSLAYSSCTGNRSCDLNLLELGWDYAPKGQPRHLTHTGVVIEGIAWALDGRSLIYAASHGLGGDFYLWRVSVPGGAEPERLELAGAGVGYPTVSRTGDRLAYSRLEWDVDIWRFEAGASPQRFLSSTRSEYDAQFSPDGKRIAFSTDRSGRGSELWVASRDGTNVVRLTEGTGYRLGSPRWSPDNHWIAYDAQEEDGHFDIYLIDAAGGQPRRLTPQPSDENLPSWSRDGKWIYFASNRSGRYEVWRKPAAGGEDVQISRDGGFEAWESWDGKTLYYTKHTGTYTSPLFARSLAGGEERQVLESVFLLSFAVSKDGVYHVVRGSARGSFGFEIRFLDLATGKDKVLHRADLQPVQGLTVSPDGKTILYSAVAAANEDLMLVENFR